MKKLIALSILTLTVSTNCIADESIDWPKLFNAVAQVESTHNDMAYNKKEKAMGRLQIRPICLKDLRRKYGVKYQLIHFRNFNKAKWAFRHYGKMYGAVTAEDYCRIWNGGPRGSRKTSTIKYWNKVHKFYKEDQ